MRNVLINRISRHLKNQYRYLCTSNRIDKHSLKPPWKVLFFGTDEFSVSSLEALHGEYKRGNILWNLEVVTVLKKAPNAVEKFASKEKLVLHNWPVNASDCTKFDIGLVVSFGHLIPEEIINSFPLGMLNVHASLLPRWRGAAPIIYAIANGDKKTGVTVMKVKPAKFDIGEIVSQTSVDIPHEMNMRQLYDILSTIGAQTLVKTFENLVDNLKFARPQPDSGVTFAPRVHSKLANIEWYKMKAEDVYNLERALTGMFNLVTKFNDVPIKLYNITECSRPPRNINNTDTICPGFVVYSRESKTLQVQCADGKWVDVEKVGVPGKKMTATDFNNGFLSKQKQHLRVFR